MHKYNIVMSVDIARMVLERILNSNMGHVVTINAKKVRRELKKMGYDVDNGKVRFILNYIEHSNIPNVKSKYIEKNDIRGRKIFLYID